ncbi:hypothetical protein [Sinanaerobacter sp. ZZT-01]|uniref:hypothetical protein n=1 Tax=Sinanaerobacter sp. ZZT-01 TaxID=3111540 RepID=UPI002D76519C|nr:hypothetical protein [Sinanaerobacter sp. ZZT-01]WRR94263.1 hypothetical protein U5921_03840 [Sinanaerobacter sp. ZZT-01]
MKKYTVQLVVPSDLRGIKQEIEKIQSYRSEQVFLSVSGVCDNIKSFQDWVQLNEVPNFILIFERVLLARANREKAREELLTIISNICFRGSKIICILSEDASEELLPFVNELTKLGLQNFYFAKEFRSENLVDWIFGEKSLQDNMCYLVRQTKFDKEKEVPIEVIKEVPIEVEKEVIKEVPVEVEKIVEKIVEKKIMVPTDAKLMGKITLGIFNLARGAGATTTAISLAENLQSLGYDTAVISMDDKIDLHYLDKKKNAAYIIPAPGEKRLKLLEAYKNDYKFILLDFGNLFDILPTGQLKTDRLTEKEYEIEEFFRCNYKIAVGFSDEWNAGKLNYFINNPAFDNLETFIFSIRGLTDRIAKQYNLNFCSSTDTALEILLMWLGIEQNRERLKGKDRKAAFSFLFN